MKLPWLILAVPLLASAQSGTVEGSTFNRLTNAGAAAIEVKLAPAGERGKTLQTVKSDAAGAFRFENVPEGDYLLDVGWPIDQAFLPPRLRPFHVGDRGAKVEVPLAPMGSLRGRVFDPQGRPVPRLRVELFRTYGASAHSLTTDAEGRFSEKAIVPGIYRLRARPAASPESERWPLAPTYFPNAVELGSAQDILIREGAVLDGFDIRLRAAPVYHLRGVVEDNEGKPAAGAFVALLSEIGSGAAVIEVKAGVDGVFELPSVRAGDWRIAGMVKRDGGQWMGLTSFSMPARDYDRVRIRIAPPFELRGVVEGLPKFESGVPRAFLQPMGWSQQFDTPSASPEADGRLRFEGVYPGRYRMDLWMRIPGRYVKAILLGPDDVTGRDAELSAASPEIRFQVAPNAARVTGTVENGAGVKVVLIAPEQEVYVLSQAIAVEVCDEQGRFHFDSLRPGSYYAFAFETSDNMNTDAIPELVYRRGLARQAEVHHLREGETTNLKLRISPWFE